MAKTSLRIKQSRPQRYKVRNYTRCNRCGRPRAVFRKFGLCRICLRELAHQGVIPSAEGRETHAAEKPARSYDTLEVVLKYGRSRERVITDLKRVSKPGRRVYARKDRLPRVLGGMGTAILSTSSGLVTARTAEEKGIGGEVVAFIW